MAKMHLAPELESESVTTSGWELVFHSSDHPLVELLFHFYCGNNFVNVGYQRIVINYNSITLFYIRVCILCMYACIYACAYIGKSVSICMYADRCIYTVIKHAYKHTLYTRLRIHKYVIHMYVCHRLTCIHTRLRIMYAWYCICVDLQAPELAAGH